MSKNNITDGNSVQQLLDLNHKISHNLQSIMLLLAKADNITGEKVELLTRQSEEAINHYSQFRQCSYHLIGIEDSKHLPN